MKFSNIYNLLSSWLSWQKAEVILIGIGVVISILSVFLYNLSNQDSDNSTSSSLKFKQETYNYVNVLKKGLNCNISQNSFNDQEEITLINEFNNNLIAYVASWEKLENESVVEYAINTGEPGLAFMNFESKYTDLSRKMTKLSQSLGDLERYGDKNGIDYKISKIDLAMVYKLAYEHVELIKTARRLIYEKNDEINLKYNINDIEEINDDALYKEINEKYIENLRYFDVLKTMPRYYKFDNSHFKMLIIMLEKCKARIDNKYK